MKQYRPRTSINKIEAFQPDKQAREMLARLIDEFETPMGRFGKSQFYNLAVVYYGEYLLSQSKKSKQSQGA